MRTRRLGAGAIAAALVALHGHERDMRQARRLAGKPTFSDRVPWGIYAAVLGVLCVIALVLLIAAVWPWLVVLAVLVIGGLAWRHHRKART